MGPTGYLSSGENSALRNVLTSSKGSITETCEDICYYRRYYLENYGSHTLHLISFISCPPPLISHPPQPQSGAYTGYPLAVTAWDGTYSLHLIGPSPRALVPDVKLDFDACAVLCVGDGVLIGGTDQRVSLFTMEGRFLKTLSRHLDWVWCLQASSDGSQFVVCTNVCKRFHSCFHP